MYRLSVAEYQFQTTTDALRQQIKQLALDYATDMGIDWEFEYRWMTIPDDAYLLAVLKYPRLIPAMKVTKI